MVRNTFEVIDLLSDGALCARGLLFMIYRDMPDRWPGVVIGLVERGYSGKVITNCFYSDCCGEDLDFHTSLIKFCELVELPDKKAVELFRLNKKRKERDFSRIKAVFEKRQDNKSQIRGM